MVRTGAVGETLIGVDVPPTTGMLGSAMGVGAFAGFAKASLCPKVADKIIVSVGR